MIPENCYTNTDKKSIIIVGNSVDVDSTFINLYHNGFIYIIIIRVPTEKELLANGWRQSTTMEEELVKDLSSIIPKDSLKVIDGGHTININQITHWGTNDLCMNRRVIDEIKTNRLNIQLKKQDLKIKLEGFIDILNS